MRIDIVFPMGAYLLNDDLTLIYGAGDKATCAATMSFVALLKALDESNLENPYMLLLAGMRGVSEHRPIQISGLV